MEQILTRKNYDFFECSSAFQKAIRRGDERIALFFGGELYCSGYSNYAWKRIKVIVSEDIGLANPNAVTQIDALYNNWQDIKEKNLEEAIIPFTHAILLLSRSPKSRLVDNAKMYILKSDENPEIPDYALDVHTRRGKKMGRSYDFFLQEGRKLNNEIVNPEDEYYENFFVKYLKDYQSKAVEITGYDKRNITHKNPKEMSEWKAKNNQTSMFK
jgi:replication-associated recombination protein RarA